MVGHLVNEGAIPAIIDRNDRGFEYVEKFRKKELMLHFVKLMLRSRPNRKCSEYYC